MCLLVVLTRIEDRSIQKYVYINAKGCLAWDIRLACTCVCFFIAADFSMLAAFRNQYLWSGRSSQLSFRCRNAQSALDPCDESATGLHRLRLHVREPKCLTSSAIQMLANFATCREFDFPPPPPFLPHSCSLM